MVQGWESRVDLANKRRAEARERKQARKEPKNVAGHAVCNFILSAKYVDPAACTIQAWVVNEEGGKPFCISHFRAEACKLKRCKFNHECTIAGMQDVEYTESLGSEETEPFMERYDDVALIPPDQQSKLKLLFVNGVCVYDRFNPAKWQRWSNAVKAQARSINLDLNTPQKLSTLGTIRETNEIEDDEKCGVAVDDITVRLSKLEAENVQQPDSPTAITLYNLIPSGALEHMCSFSSDVDICHLYMTSAPLKDFICDSFVRHRHRLYLESVCPSGRELSKMKKQEKKKKLKAANSKVSNKKDGHKKVKVCRR